MVCRCASGAEHIHRERAAALQNEKYIRQSAEKEIKKLKQEIAALTANAYDFEVLDAEQIGKYLIMKVKYPSCKSCEFEGTKVIVFDNVTPLDAIKWKKIDPHFRNEDQSNPSEAPTPLARFPGNEKGWGLAKHFVSNL